MNMIDLQRAAANRYSWGRFAARRYCETRGIPAWAYRLACQLEATKGVTS